MADFYIYNVDIVKLHHKRQSLHVVILLTKGPLFEDFYRLTRLFTCFTMAVDFNWIFGYLLEILHFYQITEYYGKDLVSSVDSVKHKSDL